MRSVSDTKSLIDVSRLTASAAVRLLFEAEAVTAAAAGQFVLAGGADQQIATASATEMVASLASDQPVVRAAALQAIVAISTRQEVLSTAAVEHIVATEATEAVVASAAGELIFPDVTVKGVLMSVPDEQDSVGGSRSEILAEVLQTNRIVEVQSVVRISTHAGLPRID